MPIRVRQAAPTVIQDELPIPPKLPALPADVLRRFPSLAGWEEDTTAWYRKLGSAIQDGNRTISQTQTATTQQTRNLVVSANGISASIIEERDARISADDALAFDITTLTATVATNLATVQAAITTEQTVRATADTALSVSITSLTATVTTNNATLTAAVVAEASARATADGFLSSKYTLTVIAGNVVTGMNITSSTGAGTDISSVIFRATDFKIYNGVSGQVMFDVSGTTVRLAGTLVVNTAGKVFIGTGTYANTNTAFYVDSTGQFSLKDKLTWDGTTLSITGSISATTGSIGGWTIGSTTISANNAILDSAGQLVLGTTNDVVYLSATDATYRIWIGNATAGSAAFRVTKTGVLTATGATISGEITATSGAIGGFNIGSDYIRDAANSMGLASTVTGGDDVRFWAGDTFANRAIAPFRVTEAGLLTATGATITGGTIDIGSGISRFYVDTNALYYGDQSGLHARIDAFSANEVAFAFYNAAVLSPYFSYNSSSGACFIAMGALATLSMSTTVSISAISGNGTISLAGNAVLELGDANLYRSSANVLKTDDSFIVGGTSLAGAGVGSTTMSNIKVETNPDTSGHCYLGVKISTGSDGFDYIVMDLNGGGNKYIKILSALP